MCKHSEYVRTQTYLCGGVWTRSASLAARTPIVAVASHVVYDAMHLGSVEYMVLRLVCSRWLDGLDRPVYAVRRWSVKVEIGDALRASQLRLCREKTQ